MADEYDVVVIGAGTGGYVAAIRTAQLGLSVAVVEKQKALGGTCLLWGCVPTKALLEHAHTLKLVQDAKEWGISVDGSSARIEMARVQDRKNRVVSGLTKGVEYLFKKNNIAWIKGTARLSGRNEVDVYEGDKRTLRARREIIVATGSAPRSVSGMSIDRHKIITSDEAVGMTAVPSSLAIIGGGAVGVEFASIFRRFGSEVTVFELLPRIVPVEDEAVSAELERSFRRQGIVVHTGARVTKARPGDGGVNLEAELADGSSKTLSVACLLIATGRGPVTSGLELERVGVELEDGYIKVDAEYRTSVPGISAIGDVITMGSGVHPQLAHVSSAEGIITAERVAGSQVRPLNYDHVPGCTYTDPEIGSVGLTEAEALKKGHNVRVGTFPFGVLGRAKISGETGGFVKIVADTKYDELLGFHMIGPRSTELVAEATLALRLESTADQLIRTVHAHPTMAEAVGEAAHALHGAAIHI